VLFVTFQGTFAAIAVALVSGSIIERVKFVSWLVFSVFWLILIYSPVAHWVWGGGFLSELNALDFAGGTVIHITAGVTGLVLAILIGRRIDFGEGSFSAYGIKFTVLGAALLWFGWFGFNGGSAGAANAVAANAVLVTNAAAAVGVLGWMILEWLFTGKYTLFGAASGAVAGLVAITPASGFVSLPAALVIGFLGGMIGYFGVYELKKRSNVDDALDAFGVHALAGSWGAIATGIFADPEIGGTAGLWYGNPEQVIIQLIAVLASAAWAGVLTVVCYYLTAWLTGGMRVDAATERTGIDKSFHGETAN
jgi:Amt family ammonium transporter